MAPSLFPRSSSRQVSARSIPVPRTPPAPPAARLMGASCFPHADSIRPPDERAVECVWPNPQPCRRGNPDEPPCRRGRLLGRGLATLTGCRRDAAPPPPGANPAIPVSQPVQREVTEYVEYTGRTDAVESVGVRARATGYLLRGPVQGGGRGQEGRPAVRDRPRPVPGPARPGREPRSGCTRPSSSWPRRTSPAVRSRPSARAASQQELDQAEAAVDAGRGPGQGGQGHRRGVPAEPRVHQGRVARSTARSAGTTTPPATSSPRTRRCSPPSSRIDPMYAYFDMDERTVSCDPARPSTPGKIKPPRRPATDLPGRRWAWRARTGSPTGRRRTSSTTWSTRPPGPSPSAACSRTRSPPTAGGCSRRACSSASACRSASRTRPCWSSTGPSAPTRG